VGAGLKEGVGLQRLACCLGVLGVVSSAGHQAGFVLKLEWLALAAGVLLCVVMWAKHVGALSMVGLIDKCVFVPLFSTAPKPPTPPTQ
jgi:hypothetical protein